MPTRILHLTDLHLHADADFNHMGTNTRQSLLDVLDHIHREKILPDLVLITGDLTHDETTEGYQQLLSVMDGFSVPIYVLPGNHDDPALMTAALNRSHLSVQTHISLDHWQIIMLDSTIQGSECGELKPSQLKLLEQTLENHPDLYTLVCLHHQPIAIGSQWLDTMQVNNRPFMRLIEANPRIKAVLWGHVHQAFQHQSGDRYWLATPATCRQFLPGSDEFAMDRNRGAGYRWLLLSDTGKLETQVIWL